MELFAQPIQDEYNRWLKLIGTEDPYVGLNTLGIQDVLRAHFQIADTFYYEQRGMGGVGPKNLDLLHSALHRQFTGYCGKMKWNTGYELCATLMFGLIKDHPFYDANKRTAFLSALYHLQKIGRCPTGSQQEFEDFTVDIAENALTKHVRFREMQKKDGGDIEVRFIADFLRRNTREIDKRMYTVTYHQLNSILNKFGFALHNQHKNFIDIVRVESARPILGILGKKRTVYTKLGEIGFPNWKAQVRKGAIKTVRTVTRLDEKNGVDSQSFFHGVDSMPSLIATYHAPLMRLANR